jgi:hypothetical protein
LREDRSIEPVAALQRVPRARACIVVAARRDRAFVARA